MSARTSTTLIWFFWPESVCSCVERDVDVGALAAERRLNEPDDAELDLLDGQSRADLELVAGGVGVGDERFAAVLLREEAALC